MAAKEYTLDDLVTTLEREITPKIEAKVEKSIGPAATKLDAINQRMEELATGVTAQKESFDEAVQDLTARMQRLGSARAQMDGDRFRIANDGRSVVPKLSDECARAIHKALATPLTSRDFEAFKRAELLTGGITTATTGASDTIIPTEYMDEFLSLVARFGQYRQFARVMPMTSKEQVFPAFDGDGTDAEWVPESGTPANQTLPAFKDITFVNEILMALAAIPVSFLNDARPNVSQIIAEHFARKFGKAEDMAGFMGTGAGIATQQPFTGILNDAGVTVVPIAAGQAFSNATFRDFIALQDALEDEALEGAAYHINRTMMNFVKTLQDSQGRFLYQEPSMTEPAQLWNFPIRKIRVLPKYSASAANTKFAFLGNMQYAHLGDRVAIQIGFNENPLWANLKVLGRAYERVAIKVGIPSGFAVLKTNA